MKYKINVTLFEPLKYQKELIDFVIQNPKGEIITVLAPRQCGKSFTIINLLAYIALTTKNTESILIEPSYKQCQNQFNILTKNLPKLVDGNKSEMLITFKHTGSTIRFLSAEQNQETLRGYTCSGLMCYDESAFIKDDIFSITRPYTNVSNCSIVYVSTPKFKQGTFYQLHTSDRFKHFRWRIEDNPFITQKQLEDIKVTTPPSLFRSEYLGEFLELGGEVFKNIERVINDTYETDTECVAGLDWGAGRENDSTAIVAMNKKKQMISLKQFNDLDADDTINEVIKFVKDNNIKRLICEGNSIGEVYFQLLKRRMPSFCKLEKFITTNDTKRTIIENLSVSIENESITIFNDTELLLQLSMYELQKTNKLGNITYNAKSGYHDDLVMALAIVVYFLTKKSTSSTFKIL